jgi:Fic family protein
LSEALSTAAATVATEPKQGTLSFALREKAPRYRIQQTENPSTALARPAEEGPLQANVTPAQALYGLVRDILRRELAEPKNEVQVAELLSVSKAQAKAWLTRMVADGVLEKISKPLRYRVTKTTERLL